MDMTLKWAYDKLKVNKNTSQENIEKRKRF